MPSKIRSSPKSPSATSLNSDVHLTYYNSEDHKNILFFRDYLKNHKKLAKEYEQIKKRTVELGKVKAVEYNEQKSSFIKLILSRAK